MTLPMHERNRALSQLDLYLQRGCLSAEDALARIQEDDTHISSLRERVIEIIRGSGLFTQGAEELTPEGRPYTLFRDIFAQTKEGLIQEASSELVARFSERRLYADTYHLSFEGKCVKRVPSTKLGDQLRDFVEDGSVPGCFARTLHTEERRIVARVTLDDCDSSYPLLPPFSFFFPTKRDTLKTVYALFLKIHWLEQDQRQSAQYVRNFRPGFLRQRLPGNVHEQFKSRWCYHTDLREWVSQSLHASSLFETGRQENNPSFQSLFENLFVQARGADFFAYEAAQMLISHFGIEELHMTQEVLVGNLSRIIEKNHGLKRQFLEVLQQENLMLRQREGSADSGYLHLEAANNPMSQYSTQLYRYLFPRLQKNPQSIFATLLAITWLERELQRLRTPPEDFHPPALPAPEDPEAAAEYQTAKEKVKEQKKEDETAVRTWVSKTMVSAGVSYITANPSPIVTHLSVTANDFVGHRLDPKNESVIVQSLKFCSNSGATFFLSGNIFDISTLLDIGAMPELVLSMLPTKGQTPEQIRAMTVMRNVGVSSLRAVRTGKYALCSLGTLFSELGQAVAFRLRDHESSWSVEMTRAFATSPDVPGALTSFVQWFNCSPHINSPPAQIEPTEAQLEDLKRKHQLQQKEQEIREQLNQAQAEFTDPKYSEYGTPQSTLIEKEAGVKTAIDHYQEKDRKLKEAGLFKRKARRAALRKAEENLNRAKQEWRNAQQHVQQKQAQITTLQSQLNANLRAQASAISPAQEMQGRLAQMSGGQQARQSPDQTPQPANSSPTQPALTEEENKTKDKKGKTEDEDLKRFMSYAGITDDLAFGIAGIDPIATGTEEAKEEDNVGDDLSAISLGFIDVGNGIVRGIGKSMYDSASFHFAVTFYPEQAKNELWISIKALSDLIYSTEWSVLAKVLTPELYFIVNHWDMIPPRIRKRLVGHALGEHGSQIFIPRAMLKVIAQAVERLEKLKAIEERYARETKQILSSPSESEEVLM